MRKIGIVGGTGWRSTAEYYAMLCELGDAAAHDASFPGLEIVIESLNMQTAIRAIGRDGDEASWRTFDAYHHDALARLEAAGAGVATIASNTPHHRFASIASGIAIPIVNLFDALAAECARHELPRVLVLGTALTMKSPPLRSTLAAHGVEAVVPDDSGRAAIVALIGELQSGTAVDAAARIQAIGAGVSAVCLACTELPLAFPAQRTCSTFFSGGNAFVKHACGSCEGGI